MQQYFFSAIDARDQRAPREETWNTVPMTKSSRTIDPNKIPKISKVRQAPTFLFLLRYNCGCGKALIYLPMNAASVVKRKNLCSMLFYKVFLKVFYIFAGIHTF